MHPEREAFLKALEENPYDESTHRIFADWLDDHDEIELADEERKWTVEWQQAKEWITEFAKQSGRTCVENYGENSYWDESQQAMVETGIEEKWVDIDFNMVMSAADEWVETARLQGDWVNGDWFVQVGSEGLRESSPETIKKFWEMYEVVRRVKVEDFKKESPFSCTC